MRFNATLAVVLILGLWGQAGYGCGSTSNCMLGDRYYRIHLPPTRNGPVGAIVFAHGYRGSAAGVMRNKSLLSLADELGVALIAIKSAGDDWVIPNAPSTGGPADTDEPAYVDAVLDDAADRFDIDRDRILATGFSAGGMMVWTLACHRGQSFAAFVPMSGTFWHPVPETCDTPAASLIHIHGTRDKIVPQDGRPIQDTRQGVVRDALAMYARHGRFGAAHRLNRGGLDCRMRSNSDGDVLGFCQFDGGHSFRTNHIRVAWQILSEAGRL